MLEAYRQHVAERAALPVLARTAALRFTMSRAFDWLNTPADALVVRKSPMAFARRLLFYSDPAQAGLFADDSHPVAERIGKMAQNTDLSRFVL